MAAFLIGSHGVDQAREFRKHRSTALQLAGYLPVDINGQERAKIPVVPMSMGDATTRQEWSCHDSGDRPWTWKRVQKVSADLNEQSLQQCTSEICANLATFTHRVIESLQQYR